MFDQEEDLELSTGPTVSVHTNGLGEVVGVDIISDWPTSTEETVRLLTEAARKVANSGEEPFQCEFLQVGGIK